MDSGEKAAALPVDVGPRERLERGKPKDDPEREKQARLFVALGACAVAGGLVVAGTIRQDVGGVVLVGGWLLFVIGLHLFGRAGGGS